MEVEDNMEQTGNNINRRAFTGVGLGAMAFALAGQPLGAQTNLTDVERASIQAARDFHTATERLTMESLTRVTSDDVVVWTPGLGPTPHVGREAVFAAWMDVLTRRNGVGIRADIHEIVFASGAYVVLTRDDWRLTPEGDEASAGSNILGFYGIRGGRVGLWYNGNNAGGGGGRGRGGA